MDLVNWEDRSTEAWAFGKDLILDSRGRPVKQNKSLVRNLKFNELIFKIDFFKAFLVRGDLLSPQRRSQPSRDQVISLCI